MWLEEGNARAGLEHVNKHAKEFEDKGVPREDVPKLVHKAATEGRYTGYNQGDPPGRPIFEVDYNGERRFVAVQIGSNGFIVGANPRSSNNPFYGKTFQDPRVATDPNYRGW